MKKFFNTNLWKVNKADSNAKSTQYSKDEIVESLRKPRIPNPFREPLYPAGDVGYESIDVGDLLVYNEDVISRIRLLASTDEETFERLYLSPIRNLATFIHALPATQSDFYSGAGGLFRLSLELAFFAGQSAGSKTFQPEEAVQVRRIREPKWKYATFLLGLCVETYRVVGDYVVTTEGGQVWQPLSQNLHTFLTEQKADRYFVKFPLAQSKSTVHGLRSKAISSYLANRILNKSALVFAFDDHAPISRDFFATLGGVLSAADKVLMREIVISMESKLIDKDRANNPSRYGSPQSGTHLEPYLIDGIRHLIRTGTWKTNKQGGFALFSQQGLFIDWTKAAKSLVNHCERQGVPGVPVSPDTLAEMLVRSGFFASLKDGGIYVEITHPETAEIIQSVMVSDPLSVFDKDSEPVALGPVMTEIQLSQINAKRFTPSNSGPGAAKASIEEDDDEEESEDGCSPKIRQDSRQPDLFGDSSADLPNITDPTPRPKPIPPSIEQPASDPGEPTESGKDEDPIDSNLDQPQGSVEELSKSLHKDASIQADIEQVCETYGFTSLVKTLASSFNSGKSMKGQFMTDNGLFIAMDCFEQRGFAAQFDQFIEMLENLGADYRDPSKASRLQVRQDSAGVTYRGCIVAPDFAQKLGFRIGG